MTADDLTRLRDEFGEILTAHQPRSVAYQTGWEARCSGCQWVGNGFVKNVAGVTDIHRAHVASVLASSPTVAALIDRLEGTRQYHTNDCMDAWMLPCRCGGDTRRAERAERERDRLTQQIEDEREAFKRATAHYADSQNALRSELAALRAAVAGLADDE